MNHAGVQGRIRSESDSTSEHGRKSDQAAHQLSILFAEAEPL